MDDRYVRWDRFQVYGTQNESQWPNGNHASVELVIVPAHHYLPENDISTIHTSVISHEYDMDDPSGQYVTGRLRSSKWHELSRRS
ncbi:hypothetical protein D9611_008336 [Ephemerocybe angulata]|uniref:Uncharacterized protein n=1 Tax=Ephemerocybe angulata TaxID=980116 RepID=A0A8H5BIQ2_9AGAR|nr:hypothetical protein D9611_008336 [Tulosesus angulatus]